MLKDQVGSRLHVLSGLATQLNEESDRLTGELKALEAKLLSLNLGIEGFLRSPLDQTALQEEEKVNEDGEVYTEAHSYRQRLGYGKHRGSWRLLIREYRVTPTVDERGWDIESEEVWKDTPLLEASRELRIAAAEQIPDLLALLEERAEKKLKGLKKVNDICEA